MEKVYLKNIIKKYFEESKEIINYKTQLISSIIQSMKEENNQLFEKGKRYSS